MGDDPILEALLNRARALLTDPKVNAAQDATAIPQKLPNVIFKQTPRPGSRGLEQRLTGPEPSLLERVKGVVTKLTELQQSPGAGAIFSLFGAPPPGRFFGVPMRPNFNPAPKGKPTFPSTASGRITDKTLKIATDERVTRSSREAAKEARLLADIGDDPALRSMDSFTREVASDLTNDLMDAAGLLESPVGRALLTAHGKRAAFGTTDDIGTIVSSMLTDPRRAADATRVIRGDIIDELIRESIGFLP